MPSCNKYKYTNKLLEIDRFCSTLMNGFKTIAKDHWFMSMYLILMSLYVFRNVQDKTLQLMFVIVAFIRFSIEMINSSIEFTDNAITCKYNSNIKKSKDIVSMVSFLSSILLIWVFVYIVQLKDNRYMS